MHSDADNQTKCVSAVAFCLPEVNGSCLPEVDIFLCLQYESDMQTTPTAIDLSRTTASTSKGSRTTALMCTSTETTDHTSTRYYEVERVLATEKKNQQRRFLVQWKNYPRDQADWVPERHCTEEVLRQFYIPNIPEAVVNDHADRFIVAIDRKLNSSVESSNKYIRIPFMHAVYYKLFGNRTELRQRDFKSEYYDI
ncbi:uncharacterized protein [Dysidea avara]|uniref:uncharacterized protein isoform X2 n=1 Tax=Dysidea avara TaxID=196820 RepID=UPI0033242417